MKRPSREGALWRGAGRHVRIALALAGAVALISLSGAIAVGAAPARQVVTAPPTTAPVLAGPPRLGDGLVPPCIFDPVDFADAFLDEAGEPDTPSNVEAIVGWEEAEGGNWENVARFNPLDTTWVLPGSYPINSVGVQAYQSWSAGLQATVSTLQNGLYDGIEAALAEGDDAVAVARAVGASPWGTPDYEDLLPPSYDPSSPSWEAYCVSDGTFVRVAGTTRVYVVAGGAPVAVTSWAAVGGPRPTVVISAARMAELQAVPVPWTLLCAGTYVYEIAGGAPLYVGNFATIGGPRPCVRVDPAALALAGRSAPFDHLEPVPVDGTVLQAGPRGPRYEVEDGVPEFLAGTQGGAGGGGAAAVTVDPGVIAHEGGPVPWAQLRAPVGYRLAASDGSVFSLGQLLGYGSLAVGNGPGEQAGPVVGIVSTPDGGGYLVVTRNGAVAAFGDARDLGDLPSDHVVATDIVALAATPDGGGYWLIGADGGMFAFGDAHYYGSLPGLGAHVDDVVGIVAAPSGTGYLLVGSDGGVFAFGRGARFHGSLPSLGVRVDDVRAILTAPQETGYVLVAADGGAFVFGTGAYFKGSLPGRGISVNDVVGLGLTHDDDGYWMATASGDVYAFGDAPSLAPPSSLRQHLPVVAIAGP